MKRWIGIIVLAVIIGLAFPVSNLVIKPQRLSSEKLKGDSPQFDKVAPVLANKCLDCHSTKTHYPWYFSLPVAKQVMSHDIQEGMEHFDLYDAMFSGKPVPDAALTKIEDQIKAGKMPPHRYLLLHWDAFVSGEEKQDIYDWIAFERSRRVGQLGVSPEFKDEPVRPLPLSVERDAKKVALGRELFHDVRLSGDNTLSCASCHDLKKGGTDRLKSSIGINGQVGPINAPTVYNSALNFVQFWDGRSPDLQDQANGPVNNPIEMGSNWPEVIGKLSGDEAFVARYEAVYGKKELESDNLTDAIATFEETLNTPNAPFDRYLRGNKSALSAEAVEGYGLFKSVGCANCHSGPGLGGESFEKMGLEQDYFALRGGEMTDVDLGRFNVTKVETDRHKFKVPLLRNIAQTAPYFHDGSVTELSEAVRIMALVQLDRALTEEEIEKLTRFLEALTGEYQGSPVQ